MKYTIGVDYGTKSGRTVIVETQTGDIVASAVKEYAHGVVTGTLENGVGLPSGWCLQYPQDYLEVLETTIPQALEMGSVDPDDVIGIAIDFTSCTILPVDKNANPLCMQKKLAYRPHAYVKLWKHHASQKAADKINEVLEKEGVLDLPRYGGRISPELMLPKILQMIEEDGELYREADEIMEAMDWLNLLLTGKRRRSISGAGYKAMYLPGEGYPSPELLGKMDGRLKNVAQDKLRGDVCPIDEKFGVLREEWADKLGLRAGTAVAPGIIDSHVGLAGCGITEPGGLMLIVGTSGVLLTLSEYPYSGKGIMGAVRGGIIPGYYAWESGLAAVGDQLEWMVTNCIPAQYQREAEEEGVGIHEYLTEKAGLIRAGGTGLIVLDWWNGNKTPFVNGALTGALLGLDMNTKPEQIYRAMMEAGAFGARKIIECMEEAGARIDRIVACGGIAEKNKLFMQIYADVTGREIRVSASGQTAALGAAMYAAVAAGSGKGGYDTIGEAASHMSRLQKEAYIPNPQNYEIYNSLYQKYNRACEVLGGENSYIMESLHC